MKYMGSKRRIAKDILPIMLRERGNRPWVEPFVGGGNIISEASGERFGMDSNRYAIESLMSVKHFLHELPQNNKEFTEDDYINLRKNDEYNHKGYAGLRFLMVENGLEAGAEAMELIVIT